MNWWSAGALSVALVSLPARATTVECRPIDSILGVGDHLTLVCRGPGSLAATGGLTVSLEWNPASVSVVSLATVEFFDSVDPLAPNPEERAQGVIPFITLSAPIFVLPPVGDFDFLQIGLMAVGLGKTEVVLRGPWGPPIGPAGYAAATITVSEIPPPAAGWMLLGALGPLVTRLRRSR